MDATTTATAPATPKKLRDGSWGALAQTATVKPGDTVKITTKAGKSWTATVSKVLWAGDGKAICATRSADDSIKSATTPRRECRVCGCTDPGCVRGGRCSGPDFDPCFDCGGDI